MFAFRQTELPDNLIKMYHNHLTGVRGDLARSMSWSKLALSPLQEGPKDTCQYCHINFNTVCIRKNVLLYFVISKNSGQESLILVAPP